MRGTRMTVVLICVVVLGGCGGGGGAPGPPSRPGAAPPPATRPTTRITARPPAPDLVDLRARIEERMKVPGYPRVLLIELSLQPGRDLHWNTEAPPPVLLLTAPKGVRLDRRRVVLPWGGHREGAFSSAPIRVSVGLDDRNAPPNWTLEAHLTAFVCTDEPRICYRVRRVYRLAPSPP